MNQYIIYNRGKIHPYLKNFVIPLSKAATKNNNLTIFCQAVDNPQDISGKIHKNKKPILCNLLQIAGELRKKNIKKIYCLTENQAIAIKIIAWLMGSKSKVVLYKQGALFAEKKYLKARLSGLYWIVEMVSLHICDELIFVSKSMQNYYKDKFYFRGKSTVINNKISHPQEVNASIQSKISIVYSGSTGSWQCFDYISKLMSEMLDVCDFEFYVYTTDKIISPDPRFHISSSAQNELITKLSRHDIGIIVREDQILNKVSSPLKVGEYLSAGLHVVMTDNIGDYSTMLDKENLNTLISGNNLREDFAKLRELIERKMEQTYTERLQLKLATIDFARKNFYNIEELEKVL